MSFLFGVSIYNPAKIILLCVVFVFVLKFSIMFSAVNKLRLVKVANFSKFGRAFATTNTTLTGSAANSKLAGIGINKVPTIHYNLVSIIFSSCNLYCKYNTVHSTFLFFFNIYNFVEL